MLITEKTYDKTQWQTAQNNVYYIPIGDEVVKIIAVHARC